MKRRETKQDAQRRLISAINNDAEDSNGDTPACPCRKPARYGTRADPDCRHCFGVGYLTREQANAMLLPDPAKEAVYRAAVKCAELRAKWIEIENEANWNAFIDAESAMCRAVERATRRGKR